MPPKSAPNDGPIKYHSSRRAQDREHGRDEDPHDLERPKKKPKQTEKLGQVGKEHSDTSGNTIISKPNAATTSLGKRKREQSEETADPNLQGRAIKNGKLIMLLANTSENETTPPSTKPLSSYEIEKALVAQEKALLSQEKASIAEEKASLAREKALFEKEKTSFPQKDISYREHPTIFPNLVNTFTIINAPENRVGKDKVKDWLDLALHTATCYSRGLPISLEGDAFAPNADLQKFLSKICCLDEYSHELVIERVSENMSEVLPALFIVATDEWVLKNLQFPPTDLPRIFKAIRSLIYPFKLRSATAENREKFLSDLNLMQGRAGLRALEDDKDMFEDVIPGRAQELTQKLSLTLEPLFPKKASAETQKSIHTLFEKLEKQFRDAFRIHVGNRNNENMITLFWPKEDDLDHVNKVYRREGLIGAKLGFVNQPAIMERRDGVHKVLCDGICDVDPKSVSHDKDQSNAAQEVSGQSSVGNGDNQKAHSHPKKGEVEGVIVSQDRGQQNEVLAEPEKKMKSSRNTRQNQKKERPAEETAATEHVASVSQIESQQGESSSVPEVRSAGDNNATIDGKKGIAKKTVPELPKVPKPGVQRVKLNYCPPGSKPVQSTTSSNRDAEEPGTDSHSAGSQPHKSAGEVDDGGQRATRSIKKGQATRGSATEVVEAEKKPTTRSGMAGNASKDEVATTSQIQMGKAVADKKTAKPNRKLMTGDDGMEEEASTSSQTQPKTTKAKAGLEKATTGATKAKRGNDSKKETPTNMAKPVTTEKKPATNKKRKANDEIEDQASMSSQPQSGIAEGGSKKPTQASKMTKTNHNEEEVTRGDQPQEDTDETGRDASKTNEIKQEENQPEKKRAGTRSKTPKTRVSNREEEVNTINPPTEGTDGKKKAASKTKKRKAGDDQDVDDASTTKAKVASTAVKKPAAAKCRAKKAEKDNDDEDYRG